MSFNHMVNGECICGVIKNPVWQDLLWFLLPIAFLLAIFWVGYYRGYRRRSKEEKEE